MIKFMFFSYRKKQKPYYFKLRLFYYKVLKLRKRQSIPTTMKEKLKKHFLKKIARYLVTFFFLIDDSWISIKRFIKGFFNFFYKIRTIQKFFIKYYKYIRRHLWLSVAYYITISLRVKGSESKKGLESYSTYEIVRLLRRRPVINLTSKIWVGNFKWNNVQKYYTPANAWKIYIKMYSPLYFRMVRRQHIVTSKWMYKRIRGKRMYRRLIIRLSNSWGNLGKLHSMEYSKEGLFSNKEETLIIGGKVFFKKKLKKIYLNGLKFLKKKTFPAAVVKKSKRRWINPVIRNWMDFSFNILEKNKFLKLKFSSYAFSSFSALPMCRLSNIFGHPFHLVNPSILPITLSFGFFTVIQDILNSIWLGVWYSNFLCTLGHMGMFGLFFGIILTWILEVFSEEQSGAHTLEVQKGFQYAILLFILSELMLFFSFFWAYFHFNLNSNSNTGGSYIPKGIVPFFWYRIPLLNTILLLSSGLSLTISHILVMELDKLKKAFIWTNTISKYRAISWFNPNSIDLNQEIIYLDKKHSVNVDWFVKRLQFMSNMFFINRKGSWLLKNVGGRSYNHLYKFGRISHDFQVHTSKSFITSNSNMPRESTWQFNFWMLCTVVFGFIFLIYQIYEYTSCLFSINDSSYGAVFFSLTGLHGLHVFIGVMSLFLVMVVSLKKNFGKSYGSFKTWRRKLHLYLDRSIRAKNSYNFKYWTHRIAFDGSAWYWHFVDVIWFFVFVFVYWWGFASI